MKLNRIRMTGSNGKNVLVIKGIGNIENTIISLNGVILYEGEDYITKTDGSDIFGIRELVR